MHGFGRMGNSRHSLTEPSLGNVPVRSSLTCISLCISDALCLPPIFHLKLLTPLQFSLCVAQRPSDVLAMDFACS